ncbi:protachykinin-1-like [Amblyraja radiata]|uniref:protachykinin-1-like n=1 Tax=Amblyraja radiata TaxID=386614 RepID=UPI0014021283|nr:protachykinin-1-like [Amblyraja radiata]XP_032891232.1 protachykinin-1-like [Amblyraja radiata]XP_032891233.1 protachykinin-1-like [Amblyraja radiata]
MRMESVKAILLLIAVIAHTYCDEEPSPAAEKDSWNLDSEKWQENLPEDTNLIQQFARLVKRAKIDKFYGLMGKRSSGPTQAGIVGRKRQKGEMFVGLMGRRSSSAETAPEWERIQYYGRRRK